MKRSFIPAMLLATQAPWAFAVQEAAILESPERELKLAKEQLTAIRGELSASSNLYKNINLGAQSVEAQRAFKNARDLFKAGEHLSCIRELNRFLNLTQIPEASSYLTSQYMLGKSYDARGQETRALRAYQRYLSAFLTYSHNNFDELTEVLRAIVPLVTTSSTLSREETARFISGLTSMDVPAHIKPVVLFLAARIASVQNLQNLSHLWLNQLKDESGSVEEQKWRASYLLAVVHIREGDLDKAQKLLEDILSAAGGRQSDLLDQARLAQARIYVKQRKPQLAIKYYDYVTPTSSNHKDALYESIFVHLSVNDNNAAEAKTQLFLSRYGDAPESFQMRNLSSYIDLRAGKYDLAVAGIRSTTAKIRAAEDLLRTQFASREQLSFTDVLTLHEGTKYLVEPSSTVLAALSAFRKLGELQEQLAELRGDSQSLVVNLGRGLTDDLKPQWTERLNQLSAIGQKVLEVGHRLTTSKRDYFKPLLSATLDQALKASEGRRQLLLTRPAQMKRENMHWNQYANYGDITRSLSSQYEKIRTAEAEVMAIQWGGKSAGASAEKTALQRRNEVRHLKNRITTLRAKLRGTLQTLRHSRTKSLVTEAPLTAEVKFFNSYAMALDEESTIVEGVVAKRDEGAVTGTTDRLMQEEAHETWRQWKDAAKAVGRGFDDLQKDISSYVTAVLQDLDNYEERITDLQTKSSIITDLLERELGSKLPEITGHYQYGLAQRLSRQRQWLADVDYLKFVATSKKAEALQKRYELEKQILNDQLRTLQQGALWKWPD